VVFVFREDYYAEREKPADETSKEYMEWATKWDHVEEGRCEAIIGKQRNGPLGTVMLQFDAKLMRFCSLSLSGQAFTR
jgi:replicative DNA helicase